MQAARRHVNFENYALVNWHAKQSTMGVLVRSQFYLKSFYKPSLKQISFMTIKNNFNFFCDHMNNIGGETFNAGKQKTGIPQKSSKNVD